MKTEEGCHFAKWVQTITLQQNKLVNVIKITLILSEATNPSLLQNQVEENFLGYVVNGTHLASWTRGS